MEITQVDVNMKFFYLIVYFVLVTFLVAVPQSFCESIQTNAFQRLDEIRTKKKHQLLNYLNELNKKADELQSDHSLLNFFYIKQKYYQLQKTSAPPDDLVQSIQILKNKINEHYLQNYLLFYDILFIDRNGDIFYTIRKQSDYHKNIFKGSLAKTRLSKRLKDQPEKAFVDYQHYEVSDEPSAFIVKPVYKNGLLSGWFALQCAINKINYMFAYDHQDIGLTGEVFLVNRQNYMLTDSRFDGESSILKKHLSNKNIEAKFREGSGHKSVIDYRGFNVLTSFEVFKVANTEWLLISKIDQDEVITNLFRQKKDYFQPRLFQYFDDATFNPCQNLTPDSKTIVVDMDEYRKATNGNLICTYGVSTCTAIIMSYPEKFAYLGHISNLDKIYGQQTTDIIGNLFKHIKNFDIYQYELRNLKFTVVANHVGTIMKITDRLLNEGVLLSQISFLHNDKASYANVYHDYINDHTYADWIMDRQSGNRLRQCDSDSQTLGDLIPIIDKKDKTTSKPENEKLRVSNGRNEHDNMRLYTQTHELVEKR